MDRLLREEKVLPGLLLAFLLLLYYFFGAEFGVRATGSRGGNEQCTMFRRLPDWAPMSYAATWFPYIKVRIFLFTFFQNWLAIDMVYNCFQYIHECVYLIRIITRRTPKSHQHSLHLLLGRMQNISWSPSKNVIESLIWNERKFILKFATSTSTWYTRNVT